MPRGGDGVGCWDVVFPVIDTTPIAGGGNASDRGHGEIWVGEGRSPTFAPITVLSTRSRPLLLTGRNRAIYALFPEQILTASR